MSVILVPANCTKVDKILKDNNINYEKINNNYISVKDQLNDKLIEEISKIDYVYVISNNIKYKHYTYIRESSTRINKLTNKYYYPTDVAKIYNIPKLPSVLPPRVNIGVIQLGGGYRQNDLTYYWTNVLKLPVIPNVTSISVDNATNSPGNINIDFEVYLDIEVIGGIYPNSNINVYFAPNSNISFINAIQRAINDNNQVISISWGAPENLYGSSLSAYEAVFKSASNKGITICVASGDNGYKDDGYSISVDYPASSPNVLSCGGTTLNSNNNNYLSESSWSGSGGGYSTIFKKPSYQNINTNSILSNSKFRCVPDVSSLADTNKGYIIYINGKYYIIGGTSASAPFWAASLASINYKKFLNNSIYKFIGNKFFNDIIRGSNGYSALSGYDLCTGIGTPNFKYVPTNL
jgi:kumamolisin